MRKKRILSDYVRETDAEGRAKYKYEGPLFSFSMPPSERKRYLLACWLVPSAALLLLIAMGRLNSGGTRVFYVALPYIGIFLPVSLLFGGAYKLTRAKEPMRRLEYERSILQMRRSTLAALILSLAALLGQAVFMLGTGANPIENLFLACGALLCAALFWFIRRQGRMRIDQSR